eukprot:2393824-Amphidinium_carterae.1
MEEKRMVMDAHVQCNCARTRVDLSADRPQLQQPHLQQTCEAALLHADALYRKTNWLIKAIALLSYAKTCVQFGIEHQLAARLRTPVYTHASSFGVQSLLLCTDFLGLEPSQQVKEVDE